MTQAQSPVNIHIVYVISYVIEKLTKERVTCVSGKSENLEPNLPPPRLPSPAELHNTLTTVSGLRPAFCPLLLWILSSFSLSCFNVIQTNTHGRHLSSSWDSSRLLAFECVHMHMCKNLRRRIRGVGIAILLHCTI